MWRSETFTIVENLHERRERNDNGNQPLIAARLPSAAILRCSVASTAIAHFSSTVGSTETPSGSGVCGSRPLSITIFTGTRWTILTKLPVAFSGGNAVNRDPDPS